MDKTTQTIYEKSQRGQHAYSLPKDDSAFQSFLPPKNLMRHEDVKLPEVSEIDLTRHFNFLAKRNRGIDTHFYPLGSCTMKLNPRVNEWAAQLPGFSRTHPLAPEDTVQGNMALIHDLLNCLLELTGFTAGTLTPCAGAHGEFTGSLMIAAYHTSRKDSSRKEMLIPDSAHGTNPATAAMAGFQVVTVKSAADGDIDMDDLKSKLSNRTAGLMMTNPNTLGLFSTKILEIKELVHNAGGLLYYDGANLNAIVQKAKPGAMGFDVMHLNLHKTFSTPHGGGGPGSGPVLCNDRLKSFLPVPRIEKTAQGFRFNHNDPASIGHVSSFYGNFAIYLRAYLYFKLHGFYGMQRIAEMAVLNANYLKKKLSSLFCVPYTQICKHEFVLQADRFLPEGIRALDIAKLLLDYGFYAPTIYFPLIVKECMLIEPTESESKDTLDAFAEAMEEIAKEIQKNPSSALNAPQKQTVTRLDEVKAAKYPLLRHR